MAIWFVVLSLLYCLVLQLAAMRTNLLEFNVSIVCLQCGVYSRVYFFTEALAEFQHVNCMMLRLKPLY